MKLVQIFFVNGGRWQLNKLCCMCVNIEQRPQDGACGSGIPLPPAVGLHDPDKVWEQHWNTEVTEVWTQSESYVEQLHSCLFSHKGTKTQKKFFPTHNNFTDVSSVSSLLPPPVVWRPSPPPCSPKGVVASRPETCHLIFLSRLSSLSHRCVCIRPNRAPI